MTDEIAPWLSEAVRLLSVGTLEATKEAIALKAPHIPPVLYRYRGTSVWAKAELANGTLSLVRASSFNDPLDSAVTFDARGGISAALAKSVLGGALDAAPLARERIARGEDPIAVLDSLLQAEVAKEHGSEPAAKMQGFFAKFLAAHFAGVSGKLSDRVQSGLRVACFCEVGTSMTLWAYYADNHRGMCFEYSTDDFVDLPRRVLWPVAYSAKRFVVRSPNPLDSVVAAMHKSPDWAHEREWRFIVPLGAEPERLEWALKPRRVFIGARASDDFKAEVVALSRQNGIVPMQMAVADDSFELIAKEVAATA